MNIIISLFLIAFAANAAEMVQIEAGKYKPLLEQGKERTVPAFSIQATAVTNSEFLEFVKKNKKWARKNVPKIFADTNYLKHWKSASDIGNKEMENSPVVNISWFAAEAYCESKGMRLPTVDEWEYLSQFGPWDNGKEVRAVILEWYSKASPTNIPSVKSTFKNKFGIWDVHGLIWEWNYDFNTSFVTGESRGDSSLEKTMFCGAGAQGAADPSDYAAFMRFGFRSSLQGNYTVPNLGFRCVKGLDL